MSKITKVIARQVFDSRGNPTIEAEVYSKNLSASSICPSGASTGSFEAYEKRDKSNKKYLGKSVLKPVSFINKVISKKLKKQNIHNQERIDHILIKLDGTKQKRKIGANAILAISMAVKKLSAKLKKIPLYKNFIIKKNYKLPYPLMNIINGGAHADNDLNIQEFMIRPDSAKNFMDAIEKCFLVIQSLKKILKSKKLLINVGDEGGFAPSINSNDEALNLIVEAIENAKLKPGNDISICLDVAANELIDKKGNYSIQSGSYERVESVIKYYQNIVSKYPIKSIEDPFAEEDWDAWIKLNLQIGKNVQIVGDDLFATNEERLNKGILSKSANSILVKVNQIGTLTETLKVIDLAQKEQFFNYYFA